MEHLRTLSFVRTIEDTKTDMVVIFDDRDLTQEEIVNRLENHYGVEFSNMIIVTKDQNEIVFRELRESSKPISENDSSEGGPDRLSSMMSMMGAMMSDTEHTNSSDDTVSRKVEDLDVSLENDESSDKVL